MQLWSKAQAGDAGAILEMLGPRVQRIGAHYARRTGLDRDELVQEGILAILEGLPDLAPGLRDPGDYLVRLARWRMLDWVRWTRRRTGLPLEHEGPVIDQALDEAGERMDVAAFVARLKPRQAQVACSLMDGQNWREVAAQMGCSSANLAYHVRQIRGQYERAFNAGRRCA
jgi:RNA polymerase sigma factor (sigma-70 family)